MRSDEAQTLMASLLATSAALIDSIHAGVVARGYDDLRPTHGFAFVLLSHGAATVNDLAAHLGVTKQAASQLVDELEAKGYVQRRINPDDARSRLIGLSDKGWACTRAAQAAATDAVREWGKVLGVRRIRSLTADLSRIAPGGPLRPTAR
ncbi:MAG TPA: MarR family transcriptional regulator [Jatrophihabitantaceae bacterium]